MSADLRIIQHERVKYRTENGGVAVAEMPACNLVQCLAQRRVALIVLVGAVPACECACNTIRRTVKYYYSGTKC
jgi:hypothetical protein